MKPDITVRKARPEEISWINKQYDRVGFKHSNFENEFIAIAEVNGEKAGLGRLQSVRESEAELGGIYVIEAFRGYGLATSIVGFLINNAHSFNRIYCLPFSHLESFYKKFGFCVVNDRANIPSAVAEKHCWCNSTYESETLLFVLDKAQLKI